MTSNGEDKYIDMSVKLKGTSSVRMGDMTTTMYVGLMYDGAELTAPGYERFQIDSVRVFFLPSTGEAVFDLKDLHFGCVSQPIEFDGLALIAKNAIVRTQQLGQVVAMPSGDILIPSMRVFKVKLVGV